MTYKCPTCERDFGDEDLTPVADEDARCPFDGTKLKQKREPSSEKAKDKDDGA